LSGPVKRALTDPGKNSLLIHLRKVIV
jgi:hypothetical protein